MCLFYLMVFILLLKVICRRTLITYLACIGVFFVLQLTDGDTSPLQRVSTFISVVLPITVLMRWGIFAAVAYFFASLSLGAINTHDLSLWYANPTWFSGILFVAAIGCGARYALAGRPLFSWREQPV